MPSRCHGRLQISVLSSVEAWRKASKGIHRPSEWLVAALDIALRFSPSLLCDQPPAVPSV